MKASRVLPALALLILLAHGASLRNGFTHDDFNFLVQNPSVAAPVSPLTLLLDARTHSGAESVRTYRPLRTLVFQIEYAAFGMNPLPYHATNLILHFAAISILYLAVRRLLPDPVAAIAASTCAVHPISTEVVHSVKGQEDLLAAIALGLALFLAPSGMARKGAWAPRPTLLVAACFATALLAKESGATLLPLFAGLFLVDLADSGAGVRARRLREQIPWILLATLAVVFGLHAALRAHALGHARAGAPPVPESPSLLLASVTQVPRYGWLFVWPRHLTVDHVSLSHTPQAGASVVLSLILQVSVVALLFCFGNRSERTGIVWFYACVLPFLNILPGGIVVFAERFAYLPLWGLGIFFGSIAVRVRGPAGRPAARSVLFIAMTCIPLAGWTVRSALRARDWRDNESLYRSALREDPGALHIRSFLAEELLRQGRFDAADSLFTAPREIRPPRSWLERRSLVLAAMKSLRLQSYEDASRTLEAITESPYSQTSDWFNLGTALVNLRHYADAESALLTGLVREPRNAAGYRMLARIYLETGRDSLAQETLDRSCNLDPLNSIGWYSSALPRMRRAGLAAAIERLAQAERQGISVRELIRADVDTWKAMGVEPSLLLDSLDARKR